VAGAGLVGRRHIGIVAASRSCALAGIVDPADEAAALAHSEGVPHFSALDAAIAGGGIDGVILATPNALHVDGALTAIAAGLPVLVEKPLAEDVAGGQRIVAAAEAAGVPVLVGHHRRYNPIIEAAREIIGRGDLGTVVSVQATTWFRKPDGYFDTGWRRAPGGGPIRINLIHDMDLMQHFAGPVAEVQAFASSAARGFAVEDTAVIAFRFASGALGTMNLSDAIAAPWSWELTARENPAYPATGESAYLIGGTEASLALPNLAIWRHEGEGSWWAPISATVPPVAHADPLVRQVEHFAAVIAEGVPPLVTARDGLLALAAVEAVARSAGTGTMVRPETGGGV
jgi:predicted dehydrogenase